MKKILGTMNLPGSHEEMKQWLTNAYNEGYEWLDSAWVYGDNGANEKKLGPVLTELRNEGITFKIQSKLWTPLLKETKKYFDLCLEYLELEKIDSMLIHRPSWNFDETLEAWRFLIEMQKAGKVDVIGVSNFENDQIRLLERETGVKPALNQIENSITYFREDRIHFLKKEGIEIQAWSPMGHNVPNNLTNEKVLAIAKAHNVAPANILLSFSTSRGINPVIGAIAPEHLKDNLNFVQLTDEQIKDLKEENIFDHRFEETFCL